MKPEAVISLMKEKAGTVQAVVSEITSFDEAIAYTIDLTHGRKEKTVASPSLASDQKDQLKKQCQSAGLSFLDGPLTSQIGPIATSVTFADWGIADTGTLVIKSDSEELRIATMLADTHIAVLKASQIVPDADAIADQLNEILKSDSASYTAFITGPSRTADIERVLAIGVHGPKELHILILSRRSQGTASDLFPGT